MKRKRPSPAPKRPHSAAQCLCQRAGLAERLLDKLGVRPNRGEGWTVPESAMSALEQWCDEVTTNENEKGKK